jgi:Uma2 family endonuclease
MATVATEHLEILGEPDGLYEVIDGRVVEKPMGAYECWLAGEVFDLLNRHVKGNSLGRVVQEMIFDLRPTVDRERRPDVAFVSFERWARNRRVPQTRSWAVVPDLAIEIVSPTNTADEVAGKLDDYFRVGVRSVWVVYPRQCMIYAYTSRKEVRVLTVGDVLDAGDVLPGFSLAVQTIFEQAE